MSLNRRKDENFCKKLDKLKISGTDSESATDKLLQEYEAHKKLPESHPKYRDEWKIWWEHRYKEILKEGKVDPKNYDFIPEWTKFWMSRMKELLDKSIKEENRKHRQVERDFGSAVLSSRRKRPRSPVCEVISSDESEVDRPPPTRRYRTYSDLHYREEDSYRPAYLSTNYRADVNGGSSYVSNESISFVTVFRQLSALEQELGLLAARALEVLSKAIELEKLDVVTGQEALMTQENLNFLETVKQKLKGLLMVKSMSLKKADAIKKSIQDISKLIHQVPLREIEKVDKTSTLSNEQSETMKVAENLASILKDLGKEDVSIIELEVLVEMMMAPEETEAQKESDLVISNDDLKLLLDKFGDLLDSEQENLKEHLKYIGKEELLESVNKRDAAEICDLT
jgi:hypothetical protein